MILYNVFLTSEDESVEYMWGLKEPVSAQELYPILQDIKMCGDFEVYGEKIEENLVHYIFILPEELTHNHETSRCLQSLGYFKEFTIEDYDSRYS
jgi:hypothetical protein